MANTNPVAVFIDPHADDADWWCGGLAMLLVGTGWDVHFVAIRRDSPENVANARRSAAILGVTRHFLEMAIRGNPDFATELRDRLPCFLADLHPDLLFIPPLTDYHPEHVAVAREIGHLTESLSGLAPLSREMLAYDSTENRRPIQLFVDVSEVFDRHLESLRQFTQFDRSGIPANTLIRTKQGRAMMLGAMMMTGPVEYAEGYRLYQAHSTRLSQLPDVLGERLCWRLDDQVPRP